MARKIKSKYTNYELERMEIVDVYKLILRGDISKFPPGTWEKPTAIENSIRCTKFLIENILQWDIEDVKINMKKSVFIEYKLSGMISKLYNNSTYAALSKVYGDKIKPWELSEAPVRFWHEKSNRLAAMDWLINTKLKWTKEDIKEKYNTQTLQDNNLGGLLCEFGKGSAYVVLNEFMEGEFLPWELKSSTVPLSFWTDKKNRIGAIRNLFENILKWNQDDIKKNVTQSTFADNNLYGLLQRYYNGSPHKALQEAYPGKFSEQDLKFVPAGYWEIKENRIKALDNLYKEKLNYSQEDIKKNATKKFFNENGLGRLVNYVNGRTSEIILEYLPENSFKLWELPVVPRGFWKNDDNCVDAIKWFIDKLNINSDNIDAITMDVLKEHNIAGVVNFKYNRSLKKFKEDLINYL